MGTAAQTRRRFNVPATNLRQPELSGPPFADAKVGRFCSRECAREVRRLRAAALDLAAESTDRLALPQAFEQLLRGEATA